MLVQCRIQVSHATSLVFRLRCFPASSLASARHLARSTSTSTSIRLGETPPNARGQRQPLVVHQQLEGYRSVFRRTGQPGIVYFPCVEANSPRCDLELRLSDLVPYSAGGASADRRVFAPPVPASWPPARGRTFGGPQCFLQGTLPGGLSRDRRENDETKAEDPEDRRCPSLRPADLNTLAVTRGCLFRFTRFRSCIRRKARRQRLRLRLSRIGDSSNDAISASPQPR